MVACSHEILVALGPVVTRDHGNLLIYTGYGAIVKAYVQVKSHEFLAIDHSVIEAQ